MEIKRFESNGRFSKVVEHNDVLYISGLVPPDVNADIKGQTAGILENIDRTLKKYGSDKEHLLSVVVYVKDMSLLKEMNEVYDRWVPAGKEPARVCAMLMVASDKVLVEISCTAAKI